VKKNLTSLMLILTATVICLLLFSGPSWGIDEGELAGVELKKEKEKKEEETYLGFGPLDTRNNFPLQLQFLNFAPDRAVVLPHKQVEVKFDGVYSNIAVTEASEHWKAHMDMEVWRAAFQMRMGLWNCLELGIEIPYIYQWHGTLDKAIDGFHQAFGLPRRDPHRYRNNVYRFHVSKDGDVYLWGQDHNNSLGDIVLDSKIQLIKEDKYIPAVSVKTAIKIPTADNSSMLGSGKTDGGLSLLTEKTHNQLHIYLNLGVVFTGQNSRKANVTTHEIYHFMGGLEYSFTNNFSFNLQVVMNSSPLRNTGINFLDNPGWEIDFGFKYKIYKDTVIQLGMIQDLTTGAPDVSIFGGIKVTF
jgi:hypothetical protein